MPTSLMKAVPPGRMRRSAVGACVWVPATRLARPSQKKPIDCFSLVVSRVHVDDDGVGILRAARQAVSSRSIAANGSSSGSMKMRPMTLTTSTRAPVFALDQRRAAAGRAGGIVERADEARRALDEDQRLFLVPGMIAERDRVGAGLDQFVVDRLGDAEAAGGVLAIDHDEIELPVADEAGQALGDDGPPAATDDIADKQNAHAQPTRKSITSRSVSTRSSRSSRGVDGTVGTS